jgi:hypothetical protein
MIPVKRYGAGLIAASGEMWRCSVLLPRSPS